jgi:quercetin dioxygenase-like cupin family protein
MPLLVLKTESFDMQIIRGRAGVPSTQRTKNFSGLVWGDALSSPGHDPTVNNVIFAPRARTFWHKHEKGQLIVASNGRGLVFTADGAAAVLAVGDIAWVEGGEIHWHGAAADSLLTHTASSFGTTDWLDGVSDEEYERGLQTAGLNSTPK